MKLFEVAEEEFLFQAIVSPTRFREGNNPSIFDLPFTKYPDDVSTVQMLAPLGKSDRVVVSKVSKQGLYFVKYNYEIFSLEIAAREN